MKKALMLASVASMIDKFNMENINILKRLGYSVDVAANFEFGSITSDERVSEFKRELEADNISVYHVPIPRRITDVGDMYKSYRMIVEFCKKNSYELVHCHSPIGGVLARIACRNFRKKGMKVIYTAHGFHFYKGAPMINWILFYPIEKICAKLTDCIITINREDYDRAKKFRTKPVEYVPGIGVDTEKIKNTISDISSFREGFGILDDDFVLLSVGQTSKRKNHEVIIHAIAKLKNKKIKYIICGFGELDSYLQTIAESDGVSDQVIFAGYRGDIYTLLHCVDLFVFPSLQEGLPVALMEAMAAGKPCVVSKIRGNVDLIEDGKGGIMCEPHDIDGFAAGINRLYQDKELASHMGKINSRVIQNYDYRVINSYMEKIYKTIQR